MRSGSSRRSESEVLQERTLPLLKFDVNGILLRSGEPIALKAPWEEVEVDVRYRLARRGTVLTRDGESVCFVCALDDMSDALDGMHEFRELVRA